MKIAMFSPYFFPAVGGTERAVEMLAREFTALGHEVRIVTTARPPKPEEAARARGDIPDSVKVVRRANVFDVIQAMQWADVGLINHMALKLGLPAVLTGKPCVFAHHSRMSEDLGFMRIPIRVVRRYLLNNLRTIACSRALAKELSPNTRVVYNGYRDDLWQTPPPGGDRPIDILYCGRITPAKGVRTLLKAVAALKARGHRPKVVLIGQEGEGLVVAPLLAQLGIADLVDYRGPKMSAELAAIQSAAKIMAIPSDQELFGIIALEGIASGCAIVASNVDGLPEAVGPAGLLIAPGDAEAWAAGLEYLLTHPEEADRLRSVGPAHLQLFSARRMAEGYLAVLFDAVSARWSFGIRRAASSKTAAETASHDVPKIRS